MPHYLPGSRIKCLHCQTAARLEDPKYSLPGVENPEDGSVFKVFRINTPKYGFDIIPSFCSWCKDITIVLQAQGISEEQVIYPITSGRPPAPEEVLENIANDYNEAALVLPFSAKASAALSRRCLQTILVEAGGAKKKNLSDQIDEVLPSLPEYIAPDLDYVREIGNFAAHEQKSKNTGEILDVEPGEAEWNLDVLEELFDFYYVKPEKRKSKRKEFNEKLEEAGRKTLAVDAEEENAEA